MAAAMSIRQSRMYNAQLFLLLAGAVLVLSVPYYSLQTTRAQLYKCEHGGAENTRAAWSWPSVAMKTCVILGGIFTLVGIILVVRARRTPPS